MFTINHYAKLSCIYEERLSPSISELVVLSVPGDEPEANGDHRVVEKLAGKGNYAVNEICFDYVFSYLAFS